MTGLKSAQNLFITLMILAVSGCMQDSTKSSGGGTEKARSDAALESIVIENIARNVIVASYRDLRDRTKELAESAVVLRQNPTQANLNAVQKKWKASRVPWESTEGFLFGPVNNIDKQIDVWPLSRIDLETMLQSRNQFELDFVRQQDPALKGFHTAEYLVFGDGVSTNTKSIQQMDAKQMSYLVSVTQVVAEQTQELYLAWTEKFDPSDVKSKPYLESLLNPGNQHYGSRADVLKEYVHGMRMIAVEVGSGKLADPLGGDIAAADGSLVESQFSWNSLSDFMDNIHSMQNVYTGDYNGHTGAGLDELVKLRKPELDTKMVLLMADAEKAIRDIAGAEGLSYTLAIKNAAARERAQRAIAKMATLEKAIEFELLPVFQ